MIKPYLSLLLQLKFRIDYLSFFLKQCALIVTLLFTFSITGHAQQKDNYNLLWRISGKGLSKPSYLFGTMHIKDKRAFGFSDSVMLAIKNCQAFALEVHPDTLIKKMFLDAHDSDSSRNLHKWLSDTEYTKLARRFEEKNGYPMGNLDPIRVESMMKPEKKKIDDKKTFVDAYLYGVARAMNKNIYGLENAYEQFDEYFGSKSNLKERVQNLVDDDDQEDLEKQEELTKVYSSGNLENILSLLGDEALENDEIIARNKVMFKSMLTHMHDGPLFTAVGVAHLLGDNGLIETLKKAGYTLTPVEAQFTGVANTYNTDYLKLNWQTFIQDDKGFSFDLPFTPMKTDILYGLNTIIYPDIANDIFFGAYAIQKGSDAKPVTEDEVIKQAISNFKANERNHMLSKKPILVNGIKGTDIVLRTGNTLLRVRLIFSNNYLYCMYAGNDSLSINSTYANRFFDSFKSFKIPEKPSADWMTFKNDTGAFSVNVPLQPKLIYKEIPNPAGTKTGVFQIYMYMATDMVNLENYLIRYNDYPVRNYLADKNKAFESLITELKSKGTITGKINKIYKQGYEGREFSIAISGKYNCDAQILLRGNRFYLLLKQNLQEGSTKKIKNDFFESFKLLPYINPKLQPFKIDGGTYTSLVFSDPITVKDSIGNYNSFLKNVSDTYMRNPASGGSYNFEHATISKYYRVKNVDSIFTYLIPRFVGYADSLIKTDTISSHGLIGREFISQKKGTEQRKRSRIFISNDDLLYFSGHLANEELFSESSNVFFTGLAKTHETAPIDLNSSKAKLILDDLLATDTTTYNYALGALFYYKFEKEELPYIYNALQKNYPDDTTKKGARANLIKTFATVNDNATLEQLKQIYKNTGTTDLLRSVILNVITDVNKKDGYDIYMNLLANSPALKTENIYQAFRPMYDSLEYVAANFNRILSLLKYPEYRPKLIPVAEHMLYDSQKGKYDELIKTHFNELTKYAQFDLDKFISNKDTVNDKWFSAGYNYLKLMEKVKSQLVTDTFTLTIIKNDKTKDDLVDAVTTRIANHLLTDQKLINSLLDSTSIRYNLMETLNKEKQLGRVPLKYKKTDEFAKLCLYQSIATNSDDEESPENIALLGTIPDKSGLFYAFKYTLTYDDDHTGYIGVCGPYKPQASKLDFTSFHAFADGSVKNSNWQLQAKKMIVKLKEQNKQELTSKAD